ncbi:anti-repressor SinI family protein [Evansella sp. AB-P1]|nr:anti-repressor SinI family protein [Evansella sp. AB-P1]MDG5786166.1 anti-repressor SinI family protein [Evansella sp. AB-P1]
MEIVLLKEKVLDKEWIELMQQAKEIGLSPSDVRKFLSNTSKN